MASRPILSPFPVITNGDMSGNLTSVVTVIQNLSLISYSLSWSGTSPAGTVAVQVSNDYSQNADGTVRNAGTWDALPLSITPTVSGSTGVGFIDIQQIAGYALRLVYTASSGVGVMQCVVNAKVS